MGKRGIIIANTGTPDAPEPEAVKRYLREFLTDPRICPMNPLAWKFILNAFILPRRSVASAEKYKAIWTPDGSPLTVGMASLAQKLEASLAANASIGEAAAADSGAPSTSGTANASNAPAPVVRCAMSYGSPSLKEALAELRQEGCEEVIVIPLYPQSAYSTTEAVLDRARSALEELDWHPSLVEVRGYSGHPLYLAAIADSIRASGFDAAAGDRLLFAFHSIPVTDIDAGDTYGEQAHATTKAIAHELSLTPNAWRIGFQCRFDKSRSWLGPFTMEALEKLESANQPAEHASSDRPANAPANAGRLFVIAPNFSVDCLETLYDIEIELREARHVQALAVGVDESAAVADLRYIPCLNDSDAHVRLLGALISNCGDGSANGATS